MLGQMRQPEVKLPPQVKIMGQLAQLLTIPSEHRQAIELVLGQKLAALLVADETAVFTLASQKSAKQSLSVLAQNLAAQPAANHPTSRQRRRRLGGRRCQL